MLETFPSFTVGSLKGKDVYIGNVRSRKNVKGQFSFPGKDCLSNFVSKIRQPIESFFNWIQEKTGTQTASKIKV